MAEEERDTSTRTERDTIFCYSLKELEEEEEEEEVEKF